ncbi:hypothetical protein VTI74DRAFT_11260 [Chaetomium olivicolor]
MSFICDSPDLVKFSIFIKPKGPDIKSRLILARQNVTKSLHGSGYAAKPSSSKYAGCLRETLKDLYDYELRKAPGKSFVGLELSYAPGGLKKSWTGFLVTFYQKHASSCGFRHRLTVPGRIIPTGLEPHYPATPTTKFDCHVLVTAQQSFLSATCWTLSACENSSRRTSTTAGKGGGTGMDPLCGVKGWGRSQKGVVLTEMVVKARNKMLALEPELFAEPEPAFDVYGSAGCRVLGPAM